jgi:hypothetical protein
MPKVVQRRFRAPSSKIQKLLGILAALCSTQMFPSDSFVNVSKALFGIAKISQPRNLGFWQTNRSLARQADNRIAVRAHLKLRYWCSTSGCVSLGHRSTHTNVCASAAI